MEASTKVDYFDEVINGIRVNLYRDIGEESDTAAISELSKLAESQVPAAMHLLGQCRWEGIGISSDEEEAFRLISCAANLGYSPAMESLGAMYLVGAGCKRNFETSQYWFGRRKESQQDINTVRIGRESLNILEFCSDFSLVINGITFVAQPETLEKLNLLFVQQKAKIVGRQLSMIKNNPAAWDGIMNRRRLPWRGSIGGSTLILSGQSCIERIGWSTCWEEFDFWIPISEFVSDRPVPCFSELSSVVVKWSGFRSEVAGEICDEIRDALKEYKKPPSERGLVGVLKRYFWKSSETTDKNGPLELRLTQTSVCESVTLAYRAGPEIYSRMDD